MSEATIERLIFFMIGCVFGYILHIIVATLSDTKEEVDELLDLERKRNESGILQHRLVFNIVFSLMIVFVFYAATASFYNNRNLNEAQERNLVSICKAGEQNREVQRKLIDAIYELAISAIQPDPKKPFTQKQIVKINSYIDRTNKFRESTYDEIRPTRACRPYVSDLHVDPPTPPQPHYIN